MECISTAMINVTDTEFPKERFLFAKKSLFLKMYLFLKAYSAKETRGSLVWEDTSWIRGCLVNQGDVCISDLTFQSVGLGVLLVTQTRVLQVCWLRSQKSRVLLWIRPVASLVILDGLQSWDDFESKYWHTHTHTHSPDYKGYSC